MKNFYMTLLSNSSMDYHPQNKTSSFTVQIPRYIRLDGEWEVGLAEIQYPYNFHTVSKEHNEFDLELISVTPEFIKWCRENPKEMVGEGNFPVTKVKCSIPAGFYSEITDVIVALNTVINNETKIPTVFEYNAETKMVKAENNTAGDKFIQSCILSDRLSIQLGYPPKENVFSKQNASFVVNIRFGVPDQMIVYCDIIEPQIFGENLTRIIRSVNTDSDASFGTMIRQCFDSPQYIPVQMKQFETVSIDIRDVEGKFMPFQYGTLSVKLHLRQANRNS